MLLSLVAHAVAYKMIVGPHNTVDVRRMWEVASSSFGMADVDACHTVDAQRHVGEPYCVFLVWELMAPTTLWMPRCMWEALPRLLGIGIDGARNTVGQISAPSTLLGF